jgi:hypothetical protein
MAETTSSTMTMRLRVEIGGMGAEMVWGRFNREGR